MNNKFVAFLDILGYSSLVENNSHSDIDIMFDEIIDFYLQLTESTLEHAFRSVELNNSIKILTVSDSIVVWSDDDHLHSFAGLILCVCILLAAFLYNGIPLRGAVTNGPLTFKEKGSRQFIYGRSITTAYRLEKNQAWSGAIIAPELLKLDTIKNSRELQYFKESNILVDYDVPIKENSIQRFTCLNWVEPLAFITKGKFEFSEEIIFDSFRKHNKPTDDSYIQTKINLNFESKTLLKT